MPGSMKCTQRVNAVFNFEALNKGLAHGKTIEY
jgi:hypothetical protein